MSRARVLISLETTALAKIDTLVARRDFASRSHAIQKAVQEMLERLRHERLARECALLDPAFEKSLADDVDEMTGIFGA